VDSDGDGVPDSEDAAPYNPSCVKQDCVQPNDADGDGVPDSEDPAPYDSRCWETSCSTAKARRSSNFESGASSEGGVEVEAGHEFAGSHGPGRARYKDSDGDHVPDKEDPAPFDPTCPPKLPCGKLPCSSDCAKPGDEDGDGVPDAEDPAPKDALCRSEICAGVKADADSDGDGVPDLQDPAPEDPGCHSEECVDSDGDGVPDVKDEAPYDPTCYKAACFNPSDTDGDGVPDEQDPAPYDNDCWQVSCAGGAGTESTTTSRELPSGAEPWERMVHKHGTPEMPAHARMMGDKVANHEDGHLGDWRTEWPRHEEESDHDSITRICKDYPGHKWCRKWLQHHGS
jgi:hypothetical protein